MSTTTSRSTSPDLVARAASPRSTSASRPVGSVLVPLDEAGVATRSRGWSRHAASTRSRSASSGRFANAEHERRARELVQELCPDLFVTLSHRRLPGDARDPSAATARSSTRSASRAASHAADARSPTGSPSRGFAGALAFFQGLGGGIPAALAARLPAAAARLRPGRRRDRRQRAGQAHGPRRRAARRHGRDQLRHARSSLDNGSQVDKNLELGLHDRRQPRRRRLGRRRRRLDRLGRRARRAAGRPAERRLDAGPGVLRPRRRPSRRSPTRS